MILNKLGCRLILGARLQNQISSRSEAGQLSKGRMSGWVGGGLEVKTTFTFTYLLFLKLETEWHTNLFDPVQVVSVCYGYYNSRSNFTTIPCLFE